MADNTIALQARPMPQTNIITPMSEIMNLGRSAVALQRENETLPYAIESAKGMASQATTGAESSIFKLNTEQSQLALNIAGGLANDDSIINAAKDPKAAMNTILQAKTRMLAQGVPAHIVEANTAPLITNLVSNPGGFLQTLKNVIQGGLGAQGQQALQTPQLTEAGGAPATFQSGTGTLRTAPIAPVGSAPSTVSGPAAPFTGQPTEPSQQVMPQTPQAGGDMFAKGMPTGKPGTFFGDNGQIVDAKGNVVFDAMVRDASGNVVDAKAMPQEYDPMNKPINRTLGTVQSFPVAPPPKVQGAPLPQAQAGVSADQMAQPASTGAGFKLSYPVRTAGEARQLLPAEVADEAAGNMYRNSLIKNQGNLVTNRRNLEEVISEADKVEKNLSLLGFKVDNAGFLGAGARKLNEFFGTETGITLKQLNKDLANVAISNITAAGGSMDTVAGQQLTKMANGDETYPPVILKDIARRAMADMTNLDMQARGAQEFSRKFGAANLNDYRQQWSKNADSRLFELVNIENSSMSPEQRKVAKVKLFKGLNSKQAAEMEQKLINLQKLSTTGQL
jgi:uncharacterized protein GlcG (DUF336 family)